MNKALFICDMMINEYIFFNALLTGYIRELILTTMYEQYAFCINFRDLHSSTDIVLNLNSFLTEFKNYQIQWSAAALLY